MRSMVTAGVALGAGSLLTATLYAANGIQVSVKTTSGSNTETSQVQLDANHMRAESVGMHGGGKQIVIFDGAKQLMDLVNPEDKTYNEITKADVDKLGGQMSDAMSRMNQAMANMTPEQRAQVEAMMRGRMGGAAAAAAKTEYRKTGSDKVGKWSCEKYEGYRNGQKVSDLCTVQPSALGFSAGDFSVTQEMQAFFSKLMPQQADHVFALGRADQGYSGVPVRSTFYSGDTEMTMEVTDISRQNIPDSTFQVPDGYQKRAFGLMGRGR
jgi:hypothetical protein